MNFSKGTAIFIVCIVLTCAILAMYWPSYENRVHERVMGKAVRNRVRYAKESGRPPILNPHSRGNTEMTKKVGPRLCDLTHWPLVKA